VVSRPLRESVGAHYGWKDWLVQRVTAVVMVVYTILVLGIALWHGGIDYPLWKALFADNAFKLVTFVFMLAVCWHAWPSAAPRHSWSSTAQPGRPLQSRPAAQRPRPLVCDRRSTHR